MKKFIFVLLAMILCASTALATFNKTDIWVNDYNIGYTLRFLNSSDNYSVTNYAYGENYYAYSLDMDSTGSLITTLDTGSAGKLLRWDATNNYALTKYATSPYRPRLGCIDKNDNIWRSTRQSNVYIMFNASDNYSVTNFTFFNESFYGVRCIVNNDNKMLVGEYDSTGYYLVDLDNNFQVTNIFNSSYINGYNFAVDLNGDFVIVFRSDNKVCKYDSSKNYAETCFDTQNSPTGLCIDKSNNIIVTNDVANSIQLFNYSDNYTVKTNPSIHLYEPRACAVDGNNNIHVSNNNANTDWVMFNQNLTVLDYKTLSGGRFREIAINYQFDFFNLTAPSLTSPPVVTINSPANQTVTNNNTMPIDFTVVDTDSATVSCELYIDSILNATNSSVLNNTLTEFAVDWLDGLHTFQIFCNDSDSLSDMTNEYSILIDTVPPMIEMTTPSLFNTTTYSGYTMQIKGNTSNTQILNFTRIIYYPNMTVFEYNETTPMTQSYSFDDTFNTTPSDNGLWKIYMFSEDLAHNTKERWISFTIDNCVPNYACGGYNVCNASDLASCNATTDLNNCSYGSAPAPSTFADQSCDYCSADTSTISTGKCDSASHTQWVYQTDNNWATCCNITQIVSDCPTGLNSSTSNSTQSCSIFAYSENDIGLSIINTIAKFFISGSGFVVLMVLSGLIAVGYPTIKKIMKR